MEFQEFCKLKKRMCESYKCPIITECCPLEFVYQKQCNCDNCDKFCFEHSEETEEIVEKWAAENPIITNADKFKEVFGIGSITVDKHVLKNADAICIQRMPLRMWCNAEYRPPGKV